MPRRTADATWNGTLTDGDGDVALGSGVWTGDYGTPEADGASDPEELLAAAHASCYAMTTAYLLEESGYAPETVSAEAAVTLCATDDGFSIPSIDLTVAGAVPDATEAEFVALAEEAEAACPLSKALAGTDISVAAALESGTPDRR